MKKEAKTQGTNERKFEKFLTATATAIIKDKDRLPLSWE